MDCELIITKVNLLSDLIENEESLFRLQLNYTQNQILLLNTVLTILACSIGFGSYLTGAFGMNLDNTKRLQLMENSFLIVFVLSFVCIVATFLLAYYVFRRNGVLPTIVGKRSARI